MMEGLIHLTREVGAHLHIPYHAGEVRVMTKMVRKNHVEATVVTETADTTMIELGTGQVVETGR
jgi:tRNA A37 methylthiotransferase MiaB